MFTLLVACDDHGGIGRQGTIPWNCPADLQEFRRKTEGGVVVMGRKTWDSLPVKPLPRRLNVVLTHLPPEGAPPFAEEEFLWVTSIPELLDRLHGETRHLFVIGGAQVYNEFLRRRLVREVHQTRIQGSYRCDTFFNLTVNVTHQRTDWLGTDQDEKKRWEGRGPVNPLIEILSVVNQEEENFLNLIDRVLEHGERRETRAGPTLSIFSPTPLEFDLSQGHLPLCTTRKTPLSHIFEELMWVLRGQTNSKILEARGVMIWRANSCKEFQERVGLGHYEEGDVGPSYGFQLRHFGARYRGWNADYSGEGIDQLAILIETLRREPSDRRMILSLWNPAQLREMTLPPCGMMYQFYVDQRVGEPSLLNCRLTQRSSDLALAGMWNITFASLLTILVAKVVGLRPGRIIWAPADAHIYLNHVEGARTQSNRSPVMWPMIRVREVKEITAYQFSDIELRDYYPHPGIKFVMNA